MEGEEGEEEEEGRGKREEAQQRQRRFRRNFHHRLPVASLVDGITITGR